MMTLTANADETTKHIEKLVSKQRVSNKKKYAVYRSRRVYCPPRMFQGTNRYPPQNLPKNQTPPQPVVPAYVRKQMKELFRSFPNGIPVMHLDSAFSRIYGTGINYRHYGFQNQYEFLQSLKDVVKVEEYDRGEWRVFPVDYTGVRETQSAQYIDKHEQHSSQTNNQDRPSKGRGLC